MAINFPTSLDTLTTGIGTTGQPLSNPNHITQHNNESLAIQALEAKVGVNSSAVTTSHDYKLSGVISSDKAASKTGTETLTNKTIVGGSNTISGITETMQSTSDITTLDVTSTKHGYAPKSPADATKFLNGATTPAYALVKDSDLSTSDVTTNDVTTSKHGFVLKAPNDVLKFFRGDATWSVLPSAPSTVSIVPYPAEAGITQSTFNNNTNTTGAVFAFSLLYGMTVNKLSINVTAVGTTGTLKIGIFSQDGQTQYISITTASISGAGIVTTSVSAVALLAGVYYCVVIPVSTAAVTLTTWSPGALTGVTGKPTLSGIYTVTASTMPSTLTIANISPSGSNGAVIRFDN